MKSQKEKENERDENLERSFEREQKCMNKCEMK